MMTIVISSLLVLLPLGAISGSHQEVVSQALDYAPESLRDSLRICFEDAGGNAGELAKAVNRSKPDLRQDVIWLILSMEHLDRLEMSEGALVEHVFYADSAKRSMPYETPPEMFREYILSYRVSTEPVAPYRRALFEEFADGVSGCRSTYDAARVVNSWIARETRTVPRGLYGPTQPPLLTFSSGHGTEEEISLLAVAILKSLSIPSRPGRLRYCGAEPGGRFWLEVYGQDGWLPMYPHEPEAFGDLAFPEAEYSHNITNVTSKSGFETIHITRRYSDTGHLKIRFFDRGRPASRPGDASVQVWNDGALRSLDYVDWQETRGEGAGAVCELGEGTYVVTSGVRDKTGSVFVSMREVTVSPSDTTLVDLDISARNYVGASPTQVSGEPRRFPVFNLPDPKGKAYSSSEFISSRWTVILLFNQHFESSVRMVTLLSECNYGSKTQRPHLLLISQGESDPAQLEPFIADTKLDLPLLVDAKAELGKGFGADDPSLLPVTVLVNEAGIIKLLAKGYDSSICEQVLRALAEGQE